MSYFEKKINVDKVMVLTRYPDLSQKITGFTNYNKTVAMFKCFPTAEDEFSKLVWQHQYQDSVQHVVVAKDKLRHLVM